MANNLILKVDKRNGSICYNDEHHIYWDESDEKTLVSVTTLIGMYEQPFDSEFWLKVKAFEAISKELGYGSPAFYEMLKNIKATKSFNETQIQKLYPFDSGLFKSKIEEIRTLWKNTNRESCEKGTETHLIMENKFKDSGLYSLKNLGIEDRVKYMYGVNTFKFVNHAIPEMLVALKSGNLRIAGQVDLPIKLNDKIKVFDYKGLPLDEVIPVPEGFKLMKDINVGDTVFDRYGSECKVTGVSEVHNNPCYEIVFENGQTQIADEEHRWVLDIYEKYNNDTYFLRMSSVMFYETKEIQEIINKGHKVYIPNTGHLKSIQKPNIQTVLSLYELGFIVGLFNPETGKIKAGEHKDRILSICKEKGISPASLIEEVKRIFMIDGKFSFPISMMRCNLESRLEILKGIIESCSSSDYDNLEIKFSFSSSDVLFEFYKFMSSMRLVFNSINSDKVETSTSIKYNKQNMDMVFKKKISIGKVRIVEVRPCETVQTRCIEVDSSSHTYLFGYGCFTTHNTNKKLNFESYKEANGSYQMMKEPLSDLMDCNMVHYTLQLSVYSYVIKRLYNLDVLDPMILYLRNNRVTKIPIEYDEEHSLRMLRHFRDTVNPEKMYKRVIKTGTNTYELINK